MNLVLAKRERFNGVTCDFFRGDNDLWMTREQIGRALGYEKPDDALYQIHNRHRDRLDSFSVLDKVKGTDGKMYETYLYSARGVYEICRWSRQPRANAFMDFVWDVMESLRTGRLLYEKQVLQFYEDFSKRLASIEAKLDEPKNASDHGLSLVRPPDENPTKKRTKLRIHSKINDLPEDIRAQVDAMLDGSATYDQISAFLYAQLPERAISRSAVGRYAQKYLRRKQQRQGAERRLCSAQSLPFQ